MKLLLVITIIFLLLVGCNPSGRTLETRPDPTGTAAVLTPTALSTEILIPPSATVNQETPTQTATPMPPTETPSPACVTLIYEEYAQFEIIDSSGQRILVDITDPKKLSAPVSASDILLTTHTHWDHYNPDFQSAFPGPQLFVQTGSLELPGVIIQGIASAHNQGDPFELEGGTNYIYRIDMGGLRIAHFGDIGQTALTAEQLSTLGPIDVVLTQLNNPYSEMNAENAKGIHLLMQVQPRLIIPTHVNLDSAKLAVSQWPGFYSATPALQVCQADLGAETQILFLGQAAEMSIKYMNLDEWRKH